MHPLDVGKALLATLVLSGATSTVTQEMPTMQHGGGGFQAVARGTHMIKLPDAQFDFKPFELKNICYECDRSCDKDLYSCTMKCTFPCCTSSLGPTFFLGPEVAAALWTWY